MADRLNPPEGWFTFGTHANIDTPVYGEHRWERERWYIARGDRHL